MIKLRHYQEAALAAIEEACLKDRYMLLQAATGAGKTIMFSELIKRFLSRYSMRILILAHREILVRQAYSKLLSVWPGAAGRVGLACGAVSDRISLHKPVIIGSPQTLARRSHHLPDIHMVIVDEAHRLAPRNKKSQYRTLLSALERQYPSLRMLGVTATPYRLGHGYIHGDRCKRGERNWFDRLHYSVGIGDLVADGYLAPYVCKEAHTIDEDLASIERRGDFNLDQLGDLMGKEVHVRGVVDAYREYGQGRRHVVVFCVTIKHAELVQAAIRAAGHSCGLIHSKMRADQRQRALADFDAGRMQFICNVGVLTEGWDSTAVDCLLLARPTMSPALYVQMIGRALRLHPGKKDALILDLSGNCRRHGDPDSPEVIIPVPPKERKPKPKDPVQRAKACPQCATIVPTLAKLCPECGYAWPEEHLVEIQRRIKLERMEWAPIEVELKGAFADNYKSARGNRMLRLQLQCAGPAGDLLVRHFLDIEGNGSAYGKHQARQFWRTYGNGQAPETVFEAAMRVKELTLPKEILVKKKGKYFNVVRWSIGPTG